MAEEGGEESLLAMIGADPKQLAEAGELDSPRNSTGYRQDDMMQIFDG